MQKVMVLNRTILRQLVGIVKRQSKVRCMRKKIWVGATKMVMVLNKTTPKQYIGIVKRQSKEMKGQRML